MKAAIPNNYAAARDAGQVSAEILIRPDGRILVHNLTPAVAAMLSALAPHDPDMRRRANQTGPPPGRASSPAPLSPRSKPPGLSPRSKLLPP